MAKAKTEKKESSELTPQDILGAYLKDNKTEHLNFVDEIDYKVSTGSVMWDYYTGGGLTPGLHRLIGPPESGKSSAALEIARNFFKTNSNGRCLYIKAEGKLPKTMRDRTGLKFVWDYNEWVDGTIFVLESNHYEFIINLLRRLVIVPETKHLYCIIFDSMDGLILGGDIQKECGQGHKVAGAPMLTKQMLQKMGNEMTRRGHMCLMLSQYSTNINLDTYAKAEDKRPSQGGGGWGAAHYAHFVFDFGEAYNGDLIKEKPDLPPSPTNKILGKRVKVKFRKSPNEKTGQSVSYPIQYEVVGRSSVWTAMELLDVMIMFGVIKLSSWIQIPERYLSEAKQSGIEIPEKFNGQKKLLNWLEVTPQAVDFFFDKFKKTILIDGAYTPEPQEDKDEAEESPL